MENEAVKEIKKEFKLHTEALKEHFDDKVGLIAEQYEGISKKLDKHDEQLETISGKLDKHDEQFEFIRNELELIKTSLRQKVDYHDFETLEKRVSRLESKLK